VGSFLVPGGAAGAGAKALGAGLGGVKAAQLATAGSLGSAAGAGEARTRAEQEGATPEERRTATQFGAAIGLSEIAPIERLLGSIGKEAIGGLVGYIKRALVTGGIEGAQEAASNVAQNIVAQKLYKPSQELIEGAGEGAAYGAGAGALTQVLLDLALGKRAGPKPPDLEAQRKAQEAQLQQQQAAQQREQFAALPGAAPAQPGTKKTGPVPAYGGTQTDIFGEVGGAYTPLQGQALPEGLETQQPEMALQDEYRKVKAEADRLNGVVEKTLEEKNIPAYNEALLQLKQIDAAQSELVKKAKATGVVLDVDAELKTAQASAQRYMTKRQPIPQALVQSVQQLQAQKAQQMQQQAGAAPGPQADLFNLPQQAEARNTMAAQMQDEYVAPVPPTALTPDAISAQQQEMFEQDTAQKQAENFAQNAEEPSYLQPKPPSAEELEGAFLPQPKQPDLTTGLLTGMEDIQQQKEEYPQKRAAAEKESEYQKVMQRAEGQLKNPVLALAISKAKGKDSEMLRKRVEVIGAAVNQGGLTSDAVSLLGLRIPEGTPAQKLPALETETGLRLQYDLRDPQQAEMLLPVIKEMLDAANAAKLKLASDPKTGQLYKDGQLTKSGKKVVALEAKSRTLQQLVDASKAPPKELKATQPLQARGEAEAAVKEREQHLFDLGNALDSLRKGTLEDPDVEGLQDKARNLKDLMIGAVIKEAKAQRAALGAPALSEAEIDATVDKLDKQFSKLIDAAPLSAAVRLPEKNELVKKEQLPDIRDVNGRSRAQLASEITRLTARVSVLTDYVARNAAIPAKLQQSLQKASGFKNLRAALAQNKTSPTKLLQNFRAKLNILNADLVALDKRIAQRQIEASRKAAIPEKQQQRQPGISVIQSLLEEKGIPIRRGMKMGASGRSELTKLRRDVGRTAYELSFPQKKSGTQYVKASQFKGRIPVNPVTQTERAEPAKLKVKAAPEITVPFETVSSAIGVLTSPARLSMQETQLVKKRIAEIVSKGLTNNKTITAILREAQAVAEKGISRAGLVRLKALILSNRPTEAQKLQTEKTAKKENKIEALHTEAARLLKLLSEDPYNKDLAKEFKKARRAYRVARGNSIKEKNQLATAEQIELQKRNLEKRSEEEKQLEEKPVAAPATETRTVGEAERLQGAVKRLEERVEAKPESKKIAKQLENTKNEARKAGRLTSEAYNEDEINDLRKTALALKAESEAAPQNKVLAKKYKNAADALKAAKQSTPAGIASYERGMDFLLNTRLKKVAKLAQARTALGTAASSTGSSTNAVTKINERVKKIKDKVKALQESEASGKQTLVSGADITYLQAEKKKALRERAAQEKDLNIRKLILKQGEKELTSEQPTVVEDVIAALTQERYQLENQKRAIRRAGLDINALPEEIARIEKTLKDVFDYDVSLFVSPVENLQALAETNREAGIATRYEGRKSDRDNKLSQQTIEKRAAQNAPSSTKTRTQGGKFGPTVPYVKKEKAPAFKRRLKDPLRWADAQDLQGEDRDAFLNYAEDANASAKFDKTDFREATPQDNGVDLKAAADVVARVKKALPKGIKFIYAPTLKDAPPEFLASLYFKDMDAAKGAVLPDGTVVVIGEAHKSPADLEETIAHELIGHYGVDTVLGPERMQALVDRLFKQGDKHVADVATALNVFPDVETALAAKDLLKNPDIRMMVVREMIAHAAEGRRVAPTFTEQVKGLIRDMVAAVRSLFRNMGLSDMAKRDAKEIQALIRESSRSLAAGRLGIYRTPDGEIAFRSNAGAKPEWMSQENYDLSNALIDNKPGWFANLKGNVLGLTGVTQFVDRTAPFMAALNRGVAQSKITDLEATQARYNISMHDKLMNNTREIVENGPMQLNKYGEGDHKYWMAETAKGKDNPSLVKVFTALNKSGLAPDQAGRFFTLYLAGLRTKNEGIGVDKLNFGTDEQGNPILTEAKLEAFEKEILSQPQIKASFQEAREVYNEYNKGLIDFAVQTGALSPTVAAELKSKKDYIPFYRPRRDGSIDLVISGENVLTVGNLKNQPYLQELVGGDKPIIDIFTSSVQNTHMLTDMALRNLATKNTAHMLYKLGMLETKKNKTTGKEAGIFTDTGTVQGPDVLRFRDDGENKYVIVKTEGTAFSDISPELLVKGMEGIKTTFPKALELLSAPAKLLRRFVVLSPLYPVRQIIKDSLSVGVTSGADFMPIITPFKNVANALAGRKTETFETMQRRGLVGGQVLAGEGMEGISTILRGVVGGKTNLTAALAWMESKSMLADTAVREAAYNSFKKQGLNDIEAWVATNEITDFNKRGLSPGMYVANALIPFFNAQIQGLNVFAKAATGRMPFNERLQTRQKFYKRGMSIAALTLLYAAAMEDDEAYKNAKPDQKYNNWFVRTPFFDEPLKIPIPYEVGLVFKAIPEAIYNTAFGKEEFAPVGKAVGKMLFNAIPGGSSYGMPQVAKPVIEMVTGVDLFTGADIESAREKNLDPAARYRENTTELAKMLGGMGIPGMSPLKVDQFIKSVGTQTLLAVVSAGNVVLGAEKPPSAEMKTSQLPVVGGMFQATDAGGIIDRTYELMKEAEQASTTYNKLLTESTPQEADAYLQANMSRMLLADSVAEFRSEMKDITDYEALIKRGDDTPAEKRKKLDEARGLKIGVAKLYRDLATQF
jgi:hypothetical protein